MAQTGRRVDEHLGLFITFEGGEGSGKSTVVQQLAADLRERGHEVVVTQEPEGTALGRHIWAYFRELAAARESVTPEAELFLFGAARAEHVRTLIAPALAAGATVLCDRFADSTVAYQGYGRGLHLDTVDAVNRIAIGSREPDRTLLLDIAPAEGLRRTRSLEGDGTKVADAIGAESLAFHERVREGFLELARRYPHRISTVDASQPVAGVVAACVDVVAALTAGRPHVDKA